jgi:hypothetical protein
MRRAINPVAFFVLGIWLLWGFGIQTLGLRLTTEVDGVISSIDRPATGAPRYSTEYILRGPDGQSRHYIAGPTYGFLPRSMPVGTRIKKQRWRLDYERNGRVVNDFAVGFTALILGIALALIYWSITLWYEQRQIK